MRWHVSSAGTLPDGFAEKTYFIYSLLINPWIISSVFATLIAGLSWMMAMTKFEISYAFPFVSLTYIIVLAAGYFLFNEEISMSKIIGCIFVIIGIVVISKG